MTDAELALRVRGGDELAFHHLAARHRWILQTTVNKYFASCGLSRDDLIQEALFGLHKAVRDFRPGRGAFPAFARLCVSRQVITALKTATREKHSPLNRSLSFEHVVASGDDDCTLGEVLPDTKGESDPEARLERVEDLRAFEGVLWDGLSELERTSALGVAEGRSYREIAGLEGVTEKTVDNAIQRVRRKIGAGLQAVAA